MKKNLFTIHFLLLMLFLCSLQGCSWFESPQGEAEIVSVHTAEDDGYRYCYAEVRISNVGNCDIYTSNISVQATSNKNTYFKSAELATTIAKGKSIYITIDFLIPLEKEDKQTITTTTTTSSTHLSDTSNGTDMSTSSDTSNTTSSSNSSDSSTSTNSTSSSGTTTTSASSGTTTSTNSSATIGNSSSSGTSNTSGTSTTTGSSNSTRTSNSTSDSTSTTTSSSTSITTTTSVNNNGDKETWETNSVKIVDNFFD